jgi:hypothetical protein
LVKQKEHQGIAPWLVVQWRKKNQGMEALKCFFCGKGHQVAVTSLRTKKNKLALAIALISLTTKERARIDNIKT